MKIRINNAKGCGLVPHHEGTVFDCLKSGDGYRLTGMMSYARINNAMIANKYAEIVTAEDTTGTAPTPAANPYVGTITVNAPVPRQSYLERIDMVGGPMSGLTLELPYMVQAGDRFGVGVGAGLLYQYEVVAYDLSRLCYTAAPKP